jgi:erythronate-4-phosphate dehydrogenase
MLRIVIDQHLPFIRGILESFAKEKYLPGEIITAESAGDADALLVRTRTKCGQHLLHPTPVQFIATVTSGYQSIGIE